MSEVTIRRPHSPGVVRRMTNEIGATIKDLRFRLLAATEGLADDAAYATAHLGAKTGRIGSGPVTRVMAETGDAREVAADALNEAVIAVEGVYDAMVRAGVPRGAAW